MNRFPYRIKTLRVQTEGSVAVRGESHSMREFDHRLCIWRISETEFLVEQVVRDGEPVMTSSRPRAGIECLFFAHQVRDWHPYVPGEEIPWPDHMSPPEFIDSEDAMLKALVKDGSGGSGVAKGKRAAV